MRKSNWYGGHLRPYLWVTCDPTPLKPKTGSLATLPLFTAPATQNYTWSLATLPTTTRENPARSLATLPTQIGRVTSDHEPHTLHTFAFVRPYLTSFYQNFPSPLQPMLSTTFLLSKPFLLSQFSPPLCSPCFQLQHSFYQKHYFYHNFPALCSPCFQLQHSFYQKHSFYQNFPPLCSPCFQLHSFYQKHSFYHNFPPPLQPMLSTTTFLLSKTLLLSQFPPPSAAHAFNYNIPFIKNILFIKIFPPSAAHAFNYIPFIKNIPFITIFPPLCSPCFQLQHSFYQKHYFYHNFPPLCSPQHSRHTFAFVRPYLTSFYHNFPPPLQPMLSTTTFLLSKTFLLSQFSPPLCSPQHSRHTFAFVRPYLTSFYQNFTPPLQPMLSTTFLLSKTFLLSQFSSPSAAHAFNYNIPFIKNIPFITIFPPPLQPTT